MPSAAKEFEDLLQAVLLIRGKIEHEESKRAGEIGALPVQKQLSARNLIHYLALRRNELRPLQRRLASVGLSSLGRAEAHVLATFDAVLTALRALTRKVDLSDLSYEPILGFRQGASLLQLHTENLLGQAPVHRRVRIMVTMPSEAASDPVLVADLLKGGMDCMRVNCAHDDSAAWQAMLANLERAERDTGRSCLVHMDLGGPKLRTGPLALRGNVLSWHPKRDSLGALIANARVLLVPEGREVPDVGEDARLCLAADFLARLESGDRITFSDNRGASRALLVRQRMDGGVMAEADRTAYVTVGTVMKVREKSLESALNRLPPVYEPIILKPGDALILTAEPAPGRPARLDEQGRVIEPARIACTLPEIYPSLKPGERIWLDDGKIGGVIEAASPGELLIRIVQARPKGERLLGDKGINLPDSMFKLAALTPKDREDLAFAARHADLLGLSFVSAAEDVYELQRELQRLGAEEVGIVLKIETRRAFERLPELLLAAMRWRNSGVMIARGDLAVELGYERLAEVQEEILWICEAAHMPVIWATQVLETLAKKGVPSRAEVTDAAMSERAECVMLNKGPHIGQAIRVLDSILRRMQDHQAKKSSLMRPLHF